MPGWLPLLCSTLAGTLVIIQTSFFAFQVIFTFFYTLTYHTLLHHLLGIQFHPQIDSSPEIFQFIQGLAFYAFLPLCSHLSHSQPFLYFSFVTSSMCSGLSGLRLFKHPSIYTLKNHGDITLPRLSPTMIAKFSLRLSFTLTHAVAIPQNAQVPSSQGPRYHVMLAITASQSLLLLTLSYPTSTKGCSMQFHAFSQDIFNC